MKPIAKTVTQDFSHEKRSISYIIIKNATYKDIRVQIFENGNFVNEVQCKNLSDAKKRVDIYTEFTVCPFYY